MSSALGSAALALENFAIVPVKRGMFNPTLPDNTVLVNITAMATVLEHHHDEMEITDHPVATGSNITDHAFKRPSEVTLHLDWSNSPISCRCTPTFLASVSPTSLSRPRDHKL